MASNTHNAELNSPSKIRGGGAIAPGALIVPDSKDASSVAVSSCDINSPALTGTPSYPRGGVSRDTQHVMNTPEMKLFRRELRTHGTAAEGALWNILKRKQIAGLQFRRQYSVGTYILDFYCPALKLAIELDGDYHYHMDMPDRDWAREQELLNKHGIKTLRFENNIVFHDPETIRYYIMQELEYQQSKDTPR